MLLNCDDEMIQQSLSKFDAFINAWQGLEGQSLFVSKSVVYSRDFPEYSFQEILKTVDHKMYKDKMEY